MRAKAFGLVSLGFLAAALASGCEASSSSTAAATSASVPAVCIHALDTVHKMRSLAAEGVDSHLEANKRVGRALKAGLQRDTDAIDALTAEIEADATQQVRYNGRLAKVLDEFDRAEAACRQAGSAK